MRQRRPFVFAVLVLASASSCLSASAWPAGTLSLKVTPIPGKSGAMAEQPAASDNTPTDPCQGPEVMHIQRPFYPGEKDSPIFSYAFQLIRNNPDLEAPTVIYLPGGPGEASINDKPSSYPLYMNVIQTDPRGVGCNALPNGEVPLPRFFSTANLASDVLAMIRFLGLKNYIIKGASYGTALATTVAYRAESGEAWPPRALVLDGVLGRAFYGDEPFSGFFAEWAKVKSQLSPEIIAQLKQVDESHPLLSYGPDDWGIFIQLELYGGSVPHQGNLALMVLNMLSTSVLPNAPELLKSAMVSTFESIKGTMVGTPSERALHIQIECSEMVEHAREGLSLSNGELVPAGKEDCDQVHLSAPYDSSKMQIRAPIVYSVGEDDPATPVWQAQYHFQSQKLAKRYLILEKGAGHTMMSSYLQDCLPTIWSEITQGSFRIDDALKTCANPTTLQVGLPGMNSQ